MFHKTKEIFKEKSNKMNTTEDLLVVPELSPLSLSERFREDYSNRPALKQSPWGKDRRGVQLHMGPLATRGPFRLDPNPSHIKWAPSFYQADFPLYVSHHVYIIKSSLLMFLRAVSFWIRAHNVWAPHGVYTSTNAVFFFKCGGGVTC